MSINITVKDRKEQVIATFDKVEQSMLVKDFQKLFLKECEMARKRKLYASRLRFTINEHRGAAI